MDTKLWPTSLTSDITAYDLILELGSTNDGKWSRIADRIATLWGTLQGHEYINSLLFDDRPTVRQGFPINVLSLLHAIQHEHFRYFSPPESVWDPTFMK